MKAKIHQMPMCELAEISAFGTLAFETRKSGGRPTEFAMLNERQALLLISLMRNTKAVVTFKVRLVQEFCRMAESLRNRDLTMWERRILFEAKDMNSRALGSFGSHLMLDRKREKPRIESERHLIEAAMQPSLLHH
ncbi:Rha family transcriptional regulator [Limnohabitans sp.]|uniref:Rha family transcriptional regulator n=1 Tax=Limnohabitans sp. TaxID=1907725 RepID=UPI00286F36BC|nr:Rha family transcriptional regulator [Limnohabitans sp.]